jgi:choline-sulfatase
MVKQGPWKYWALAPDRDVLFNLEEDPHEEIDLAGKPESLSILKTLKSIAENC